MKKALIITSLLFGLALPCLAWSFMKTATSVGGKSTGSAIPTNAPGAFVLGFGGENIQGFGGENIQGLP